MLDTYGNITLQQLYDYGNLSTPARTYNFYYLTDSAYTSRYIRNRLTSASLTAAGGTTTLVTNTYDQTGLTDRSGLVNHDSGYSTAFLYRGNATRSITPAATRNNSYNIGGMARYY